jgi:hypothetical protein
MRSAGTALAAAPEVKRIIAIAVPNLVITLRHEGVQPKGAQMTEKMDYSAEFADLFLKGVERAADMQKKSLEAAVQLNAKALESMKKAAQAGPRTVGGVFDLAEQALEQYAEAHKKVIDQMVKQTTLLVETTRAGGESAKRVAAEVTKTIQQSMEQAVEAEKKSLGFGAQQAKSPRASKRKA